MENRREHSTTVTLGARAITHCSCSTSSVTASVKGGGILGHGAEQKYTSRSSVFSENVRLRWVSPGALSGSEAGGV